MKKEPTILDYFLSLFHSGNKINLSQYFIGQKVSHEVLDSKEKTTLRSTSLVYNNNKTWYLFIILLTAILAQTQLDLPQPRVLLSVLLYTLSAVLLISSSQHSMTSLKYAKPILQTDFEKFTIRKKALAISIFLLASAFVLFGKNEFTYLNTGLWLTGIAIFIFSIWQHETKNSDKDPVSINILLIAIFVFIISFFFRFFQLSIIPGEMFSDHAEKLLDVMDVLSGETPIFFIRNTGREPLQFYITAAIIRFFNTGISFLSLKIGTATAGFLTLFFLYKLGEEMGGKRIGIMAAFFAGIAYWPNVISRVGLRFPFYPLFVAPVIYYIFKGLREKRINSLILAGLFLGFGLHGYSPIRVLPLLVLVIFVIFIFSNKTEEDQKFAIKGLSILVLIALIVFLPLFRYLLENPGNFNYRLMSRLTSLEAPIDEPTFLIFLENLWKSLVMFFFRNGVIWVNSIPNRPALDIFSAAFFFIGLIQLSVRLFQKNNNWREISILVSIPILMLPSILSLAFPQENPSLNRSSGAIVPVFFLCSIGFFTIFSSLLDEFRWQIKKVLGMVLFVTCLLGAIYLNYDLVFNQFRKQFVQNAWNSSEIGSVIKDFVDNGNNPNYAYVIPYPHWVDTRLVGINAGFPAKDYALWIEDIEQTLPVTGDQLFILKPEDQIALDKIKSYYSNAREEIYYSRTPGKDFIKVYVKY